VDGIEKTIEWYLRNRKWWGDIVSGEYMKYYEKMYGERLKLGTGEILKGSDE
jgi:dTDP-glucose 4,6-dehydratase